MLLGCVGHLQAINAGRWEAKSFLEFWELSAVLVWEQELAGKGMWGYCWGRWASVVLFVGAIGPVWNGALWLRAVVLRECLWVLEHLKVSGVCVWGVQEELCLSHGAIMLLPRVTGASLVLVGGLQDTAVLPRGNLQIPAYPMLEDAQSHAGSCLRVPCGCLASQPAQRREPL